MSTGYTKGGARARKEKRLVQTWVAAELHDALAALAEAEDLPMAGYLRKIVRQHVKKVGNHKKDEPSLPNGDNAKPKETHK